VAFSRVELIAFMGQDLGLGRYRSDFHEEESRKCMIFSKPFFVMAAVLGIVIVGISIDPELLSLVLKFEYGKLFSSHFWTISAFLLVGIGLVIVRKQSRKQRGRNRDQEPPSRVDTYRSSHPYNK